MPESRSARMLQPKLRPAGDGSRAITSCSSVDVSSFSEWVSRTTWLALLTTAAASRPTPVVTSPVSACVWPVQAVLPPVSLISSLIHVRPAPSITVASRLLSRHLDEGGPLWTEIPNPEKRIVGGSTPPLTTTLTRQYSWSKILWSLAQASSVSFVV